MSQGFAASSQKNYGSTSDSRIPDVCFSNSGTQFSPTEMYDLPDKIITNIQAINASFKQFEQSHKSIGTSKDSVAFRSKLHENQVKLNGIITQTTKDLQRLSVIVKRGDKKQKLHVDKLTANFKEAVQMYSSIQKKVAEKMKTTIIQPEVHEEQVEDGTESTEDNQKLLSKQEMVNKELEFEKGLLIEREQRIQQIEGDLLDVNQIMRELASLVLEQGSSINTVEDNIENAHSSVEAGHRELEKAASYQDKRRRRTCILLGISVAIGLILAIIITVTLK